MKNKYLYLFLISVIMMILSGCTLRTSDGFTSEKKVYACFRMDVQPALGIRYFMIEVKIMVLI